VLVVGMYNENSLNLVRCVIALSAGFIVAFGRSCLLLGKGAAKGPECAVARVGRYPDCPRWKGLRE